MGKGRRVVVWARGLIEGGLFACHTGGDLRAWLSKAGNLVRNADPRPAPDYASESALMGRFHPHSSLRSCFGLVLFGLGRFQFPLAM